jgi:hypothetical protein
MSVQVLRIILLITVAVCIKIMYKCKIASPGRVAAWIVLFPSALFLIDYAALFVFRGLASNAELLSAIYAVGTVLAGIMTAWVYFAIYKSIVGETETVRAIIKKQPKWYYAVVAVFVLTTAVLNYIQDVSVAAAASSMMQLLEEGNTAGFVCVLGGFEAQKAFDLARYIMAIAVAALTVYCVRKRSAAEEIGE